MKVLVTGTWGFIGSHPFAPTQNTEHPVSLYAATKKPNEMMAHAYSHLFGRPTKGLRFFTIYRPWDRPVMAVFIFVKTIIDGNPIDVYDGGAGQRSFTYVDDVVEEITKITNRAPGPKPGWSGNDPDPSSSSAPHRIYNIGSDDVVIVNRIFEELEEIIGEKANQNDLPERRGDVRTTFADISDLKTEIGYKPTTRVSERLVSFVEWYREYYR